MRIRVSKLLTLTVVVVNLLLFFISWKIFFISTESSTEKNTSERYQLNEKIFTQKAKLDRVQEAKKFLQQSLTIIFRDFYHFDNDLKSSIDHLLALVPNLRILIISEDFPYPPINIFASNQPSNQTLKPSTLIYKENVQFLWLSMDITKSANELNPLNYIQTKYTLFMPDNFKLANARQMFQRMMKSLAGDSTRWSRKRVLVIPFTSNQRFINYCFQINCDIPNWTLEYEVKNHTNSCDLVGLCFYCCVINIRIINANFSLRKSTRFS
jgi:fukutin-related protein